MIKRPVTIILLFLGLIILSACQSKEPPAAAGPKKLTIIATLFPVYDFARIIGGDRAAVTLLLPPGVEAHSFQPKPEAALRVSKADIFVYTNEFMEPWAVGFARKVSSGNLVLLDASKGVSFLKNGVRDAHENKQEASADGHHEHGSGMDPHIWLDFSNAQIMVDTIAAAMAARDPANSSDYLANAPAYKAELAGLDAAYRSGLASCSQRTLLHGGHYTFGYLANRYGLDYQSASAVNADAEPTPAKLIALVKQIRASGLRHVFSEELLSPRVSEVIAREAGVDVLLLHGAHNITREDFERGTAFIPLMRRNLESLRIGLQCR